MANRHLSHVIQSQFYYDDLPIGTVLWWDESLMARTGDSRTSGTSTNNVVSRSDCQSSYAPTLNGDTNAIATNNATFAQDSTVSYYSTYSYKFTQTGDTDSKVAFGDTFGDSYLTFGNTYFFEVALYFPSTTTIDINKVSFVLKDYVSAWEEKAVHPREVYDQWQILSIEKQLRNSETKVSLELQSGDTGSGL